MAWMARFSARSPPRLSRCRTVMPLLAGTGLVPPRAANAASLRHRPGWEKLTMAWAALTGPTPKRLVRPGAMSSTMASSRVAPLLSKLSAAGGRSQISEFLWYELEDHFGLDPDRHDVDALANRLVAWWAAAG
jgi:hypothetical protein